MTQCFNSSVFVEPSPDAAVQLTRSGYVSRPQELYCEKWKRPYTTNYNVKQNKINEMIDVHPSRMLQGQDWEHFIQLERIREGIPGEQTMCWPLEGREGFGRSGRGRGGRLSRLWSFVSLEVRCILGTCGLQ